MSENSNLSLTTTLDTPVTSITIPEDPLKPGAQTTEFWGSLVAMIIPSLITILSIYKLVPSDMVSTMTTAAVALANGLIILFITLKYIKSRTDLKSKSMDHRAKALTSLPVIRALPPQVTKNEEKITKMNYAVQLFDRSLLSKEETVAEYKKTFDT